MTSYLVLLGILVCFSAILALALNFQWGLGGMVNFGLTGFYALGAYASALFMLKAGANSFFAVVGAMAVVAAVCALVAFVTLRVTEEDYFAIVTLGVGEMLRLVALNEDWLTKGALGLAGIPRPFGDVIAPQQYQYFLLALAVVLLLATLWFLNAVARISLPKRSEEHTSELQSLAYLVCRLLLEKKKKAHRRLIIHHHNTRVVRDRPYLRDHL